jgi:hypothetical protein
MSLHDNKDLCFNMDPHSKKQKNYRSFLGLEKNCLGASLIASVKLRFACLWQWYINIILTIIDIILRPVFYLKHNWTLWVCPYLTGNTIRLRYDSNRLMLSIGLWQWYINITITILDIIHRSVIYLKQCFGDWILSPSSHGTYTVKLFSIPYDVFRNIFTNITNRFSSRK